MGRDRRRHQRAKVGLDVALEAADVSWQGKTVDLSPYGVKVALLAESTSLPPGTNVQLSLSLSDEGSPVCVPATVVRTDSEGMALNFDGLGDQEFQRLKDLVGSLLVREWKRMIRQLETGQSPDAGAGLSNEPLLEPQELSFAAAGEDSQRDAWQAVLGRAGLDVQLPDNGSLSSPWLEFLKQLGADVKGTGMGERTQKVGGGERKNPFERAPSATPQNPSTPLDPPPGEVEAVVSESRQGPSENRPNTDPVGSQEGAKEARRMSSFLSYFLGRDR